MSKMRKNQNTIHIISILIISGMFIFIPFYIALSESSVNAIEEVWVHIKSITFIVLGYLYGSNGNNKAP